MHYNKSSVNVLSFSLKIPYLTIPILLFLGMLGDDRRVMAQLEYY